MTNYEYYFEELNAIGSDFSLSENESIPIKCYNNNLELKCKNCIFDSAICEAQKLDWLFAKFNPFNSDEKQNFLIKLKMFGYNYIGRPYKDTAIFIWKDYPHINNDYILWNNNKTFCLKMVENQISQNILDSFKYFLPKTVICIDDLLER